MNNTELMKLIQDIKQQKPQAQRKMFDLYNDTLFAVSMRYALDRFEAEDVLMESWIKVFLNIDAFEIKEDFEPKVFEKWLKTIVVNTAINVYNKNKKMYMQQMNDKVMFDNDRYDFFEKDYRFSEEQLMNALTKLPSGLKLVFSMFAIEGYKNGDIAKELGISKESVKVALYKARKILKQVLEGKQI